MAERGNPIGYEDWVAKRQAQDMAMRDEQDRLKQVTGTRRQVRHRVRPSGDAALQSRVQRANARIDRAREVVGHLEQKAALEGRSQEIATQLFDNMPAASLDVPGMDRAVEQLAQQLAQVERDERDAKTDQERSRAKGQLEVIKESLDMMLTGVVPDRYRSREERFGDVRVHAERLQALALARSGSSAAEKAQAERQRLAQEKANFENGPGGELVDLVSAVEYMPYMLQIIRGGEPTWDDEAGDFLRLPQNFDYRRDNRADVGTPAFKEGFGLVVKQYMDAEGVGMQAAIEQLKDMWESEIDRAFQRASDHYSGDAATDYADDKLAEVSRKIDDIRRSSR